MSAGIATLFSLALYLLLLAGRALFTPAMPSHPLDLPMGLSLITFGIAMAIYEAEDHRPVRAIVSAAVAVLTLIALQMALLPDLGSNGAYTGILIDLWSDFVRPAWAVVIDAALSPTSVRMIAATFNVTITGFYDLTLLAALFFVFVLTHRRGAALDGGSLAMRPAA